MQSETGIQDRDNYDNWFKNEFLTDLGSLMETDKGDLANSASTPMIARGVHDINPESLPILDMDQLLDTPNLDMVVRYHLNTDTKLPVGELPSNLNFQAVEQPADCWAPDDCNNNLESEDEEDQKFLSEVYRELVDEDKKLLCQQFREQNKTTKKRSDSYRQELKTELKLDTFQGHKVTNTRSPWGQGYPLPITPAGSDHESIKGVLSPVKATPVEEDLYESDLEVESMEVEICGPEYDDIVLESNSPDQPTIVISKEEQMEWSHEMATLSRNFRNGTLGKN